jgi:hypothetical protein
MSTPDATTLTAEAVAAWQAGASKDQLAAKMFDAAFCLSLEAIGPLATIDALLCALNLLSLEFPQEFATLRRLDSEQQYSGGKP